MRGGRYPELSLAMGLDGFPVISYQDVFNGTLKVAKCVNSACAGASTITSLLVLLPGPVTSSQSQWPPMAFQ